MDLRYPVGPFKFAGTLSNGQEAGAGGKEQEAGGRRDASK